MEYLTPEDYKVAERNGIRYLVAYKRFYEYGWDKEKTITHPIIKSQGDRVRKYSDELMQQAKDNGISDNLFYRRINKLGWTPERASIEPPKASGRRKCPYVQQAKDNGIKLKTYYNRLSRGWTREEASTTPIDERYLKSS